MLIRIIIESKKAGASRELIPCHICFGLNRCEGYEFLVVSPFELSLLI